MISLSILEEEKEKLTIEGYSGVNAHKLKKAGDGIGLSSVNKLLKLHGANLIIKVRATSERKFYDNSLYESNHFEMHFKTN